MISAHIFSSNWKFIEIAQRKCQIAKVFFEEQKISVDLYDYLEFNRLNWQALKKLPMSEESEIFVGADLGLCFGFGQIFSNEHIEKFRYGIWNIHPGELPKYRGRHPITHAFLNGDGEITVTVHQINNNIDQGSLISTGLVRREFRDTEEQIISKIIELLDISLLETSIRTFFSSPLEPIGSGNYLKNFYDGIQFKNPISVSREIIYNAALSQKSHGGLRISGKNYQHVHFYSALCLYPSNSTIIECNNGFIVAY